jgi:hypothetical protein
MNKLLAALVLLTACGTGKNLDNTIETFAVPPGFYVGEANVSVESLVDVETGETSVEEVDVIVAFPVEQYGTRVRYFGVGGHAELNSYAFYQFTEKPGYGDMWDFWVRQEITGVALVDSAVFYVHVEYYDKDTLVFWRTVDWTLRDLKRKRNPYGHDLVEPEGA